MTRMKKYLAIIFIGCLLVSCVDKLDKFPIIGELDSNFYQDEGDAYAALTAAYDPLQYNYLQTVSGLSNLKKTSLAIRQPMQSIPLDYKVFVVSEDTIPGLLFWRQQWMGILN